MTALLRQAFDQAAALPADEQDALAARMLDELAAEDAFDSKLSATGGRLAGLAAAAVAGHRAGETDEFGAERGEVVCTSSISTRMNTTCY